MHYFTTSEHDLAYDAFSKNRYYHVGCWIKKYGFIVNDTYVGKYMNIYEDGSEGYMNGEQLNLK